MKRCILFFVLIFQTVSGFEQERKDLLNLLAGEWISAGIYTTTALGIPEQLDEGSKDIKELALQSETDEEGLYRLMRMLSSVGIYREENEKIFTHSDRSRLLSKKHPFSLHAITHFYYEVLGKSWVKLPEALKVDKPGFELLHEKSVFQYFKENPKDFELFQKAMAEKSKAVVYSSLTNYDFSQFSSVYDICGGNGHFVQAITRAFPHVKGVLYELKETLTKLQKRQEFTLIEGDFFVSIPGGGDCYLLKSIIHDWSDDDAKKILTNCHKAMPYTSRLLILEPIIQSKNTEEYAKLTDVLMFNITGGKERSLEEFKQLLEETGFQIKKVYQTSTEFSIIEAVKKQK